ncbi:MAG: hypothetical protein Ct9H300mP1_15570 [Planctomycetaceae bacterium]|nr:MAG: hypothetical protein Ct9H300mP1_15570 [Planctomycetaceae bacterium]
MRTNLEHTTASAWTSCVVVTVGRCTTCVRISASLRRQSGRGCPACWNRTWSPAKPCGWRAVAVPVTLPCHRPRTEGEMGNNFGDLARILWTEVKRIDDVATRAGVIEGVRTALVSHYSSQVGEGTTAERFARLAQVMSGERFRRRVG